jgi:guanylate kinase
VLIFILPPSLDVLERRLKGRRSDAEDVIARRLAVAPAEIAHAVEYDYVVVNGELDAAIARVRSIVEAEKSRRERCYRPAADSPMKGGTDRA